MINLGTCSAKIKIKSSLAKEMLKTIQPENAIAPKNLSINCYFHAEELICDLNLTCNNSKELLRLRNTIDDILHSLKIFLNTVDATSESL